MILMLKYFFSAIKQNKKYFFISLFVLLLICLVNIAIPFLLKLFLDNFIDKMNVAYISIGIACFLVLYVISIVLNILWNISLDKFAGKYISILLKKCQLKLSNTYFENIDKLKPNIIKNILFGDVLDIFRIVGKSIPTILASVIVIISVSVLSLIINYKIASFILLSILFGILLAFISRKKLDKVGTKTNQAIKKLNGINIEFVDMLEVIQSNNLLKYYSYRTETMVNDFMSSAIKEDKKIYFWTGVVSNYNSLFSLILSIILSLPFANHSLVNMAFFILLSNILITYSQNIELTIQQIIRSAISFRNVENIIHLPQRRGIEKLAKIDKVVFDSVSFMYPETEKWIFKDFSFCLKKGDCIRLKGVNGSGKTTFIKLLTNLYSIHSGKILYNNLNVKDISSEVLVSKVLYISQEEAFINESIEDYLKIISPNMNKKIDFNINKDILNLNKEYQIENNGLNLSVGQRKKLLILKLLYLYDEAEIIILDELFAGLDAETKDFLVNFLNTKIEEKEKIFIFISHEENNLKYNKKLTF